MTTTSEYLATSYRPDRELIDGQLVERNVGEWDHSNLLGALVGWMSARDREWNIRSLISLRIQVASNRFRVPDLCAFPRDREIEQIPTTPPLICIEVLSQDDTLLNMQDRVDDYVAFGVPNIWILDPVKRRAYVCSHRDFREPEKGILEVANSPFAFPWPTCSRTLTSFPPRPGSPKSD
jgi:Uma2 family endonuclease